MWLCRRRELRRKQGLRRLRRSYRWGIREKRRPGGGPGCGGDGCEKWLRVDGRLRACRFETLTEAREFIPGKVNFADAVTVRGRPSVSPVAGCPGLLAGTTRRGAQNPEIRLKSTGNQPVSKNSLPNPQLAQLISSISFPYPCAGARAPARVNYHAISKRKTDVVSPKMKPINKLIS